jgi:glucose-6-phosphate dehydrogenase assembly protein OpcA
VSVHTDHADNSVSNRIDQRSVRDVPAATSSLRLAISRGFRDVDADWTLGRISRWRQIMAEHFDEPMMFRVAYALEQALGEEAHS